MMVRNICESYPGLSPTEVETWHFDKIYALGLDRKVLEKITGAIVTGTPSQLAQRGIIPREKESLLSILKREKAEKEQRAAKESRRQRRKKKREAAIAYKKSRGEL